MRLFALSSWKRLCVALLLLVVAPPAVAQDALLGGEGGDDEAPFDITADSVEYESERDLYVARGHVLITQPGRSLTADWVAFSNETRLGVATGNVVVSEAGDTLYADVLSFEIDTLRGIVLKGRLDARESGFEMTGETIRRTGEETYVFDEGTFTTCRCPEEEVEPWMIRAKKADIEVGGYATTRNTSFDILGIPVLWLPWMRYPVKTERETGLLLPIFSTSSRNGGEIGIPFFWAALPNLNVTLTPTYLFKRGFKPNLDIEYVFGERSGGSFYGTILRDKDVHEDDLDTPFGATRWGAEWRHDHFLPAGWRAKVDATVVSDNLFPYDFDDFSSYKHDRYLESVGFAEKRFGPLQRYGFAGSIWYADDLQNPDDQDRDPFLLQRLPELELAGLPQPLPWTASRLYGSFGVDFTNFYSRDQAEDVYPSATVVGDDVFLDTGIEAIPDGHERNRMGDIVTLEGNVVTAEGAYLTAEQYLALVPPDFVVTSDGSSDDFPPGPENDGKFQEGEPLGSRGQRLVLNPRLAAPFRIGDVVEVYPELGYHGTFYHTSAQDFEARNLLTAMVDARMRLRGVVDLPFGLGKAVHLMEPRLVYTGITQTSQRGNPLFVPRPAVSQERIRQFDLFNVTRDPSDRIDSVNAVNLGLGNRFWVPGEEGRPPQLFADVAFSTQWDFADEGRRNFFVEGMIRPFRDLDVRFNAGYDLDETRISEGLMEFRYSVPEGHDLSISYRYLRDIPRFFESFEADEDRYDKFEEGFQRINQITLRGRLALTRNWAFIYRGRFSFESSIFLTNRGGVEYISKCRCWAVQVEVSDERSGGVDFNLRYVLIGLGDDDVRPFDGGSRRNDRRASSSEEPL